MPRGPLVVLDDTDTEAGLEGATTSAPPGTTSPPPMGTTTAPPSTTLPPGTTLPPSDESTSGEPMTSLVFLDGLDTPGGDECELWAQDCLPDCDPLLQTCPEGQACVPLNAAFACVVDASGEMGAVGDECELLNVCDPGNYCASADQVPDCTGIGCCTAFCDVTVAPPVACLPGQECMPWYEEGRAPGGFEPVGVCALPT